MFNLLRIYSFTFSILYTHNDTPSPSFIYYFVLFTKTLFIFRIPTPIVPNFNDVINSTSNAIGIAIVAFAITVSLGQLFAKKHDYEVDSNQELLAMGASNIIGSFMSSFVSTASLSRSLVQETAGCVTQVLSNSTVTQLTLTIKTERIKTFLNS